MQGFRVDTRSRAEALAHSAVAHVKVAELLQRIITSGIERWQGFCARQNDSKDLVRIALETILLCSGGTHRQDCALAPQKVEYVAEELSCERVGISLQVDEGCMKLET